MKKKTAAIVCVLAMLLLSGCGKKEQITNNYQEGASQWTLVGSVPLGEGLIGSTPIPFLGGDWNRSLLLQSPLQVVGTMESIVHQTTGYRGLELCRIPFLCPLLPPTATISLQPIVFGILRIFIIMEFPAQRTRE